VRTKAVKPIAPGKFWESANQEVVRVLSHQPPNVRFEACSYDGAALVADENNFVRRFRQISCARAHYLLQPRQAFCVCPAGVQEPKMDPHDYHTFCHKCGRSIRVMSAEFKKKQVAA